MNEIEYLLVCLAEECAEVQQIVAKILRFGLNSHHPDKFKTNLQELHDELIDLDAIREMLNDHKVDTFTDDEYTMLTAKMNKVKKYMEISRKSGMLQ